MTAKRIVYTDRHVRNKIAYGRLFQGSDADVVLHDLNDIFNGTTLKKVEGLIDPHACIAAAGCREVLLYIKMMMEPLKEAKEDALD